MVKVFVKDDKEVGYEYINFDKEAGWYVLYKHDDTFKLYSGAKILSYIIFTEQSFDSNKRDFGGLADWEGDSCGISSECYEFIFDT